MTAISLPEMSQAIRENRDLDELHALNDLVISQIKKVRRGLAQEMTDILTPGTFVVIDPNETLRPKKWSGMFAVVRKVKQVKVDVEVYSSEHEFNGGLLTVPATAVKVMSPEEMDLAGKKFLAAVIRERGEVMERTLRLFPSGKTTCCDAHTSFYDDGTGVVVECCKKCMNPVEGTLDESVRPEDE